MAEKRSYAAKRSKAAAPRIPKAKGWVVDEGGAEAVFADKASAEAHVAWLKKAGVKASAREAE